MSSDFSTVRSFTARQSVFKDECVYSFVGPDSEFGLYICLKTFQACSKEWLEFHMQRTGNSVFLHWKRIRHLIEKKKEEEEDASAPSKMAIGVEGGFDVEDKYENEDIYHIIVFPSQQQFSLDDPSVPSEVQMTANAVVASQSATLQEDVQAWEEQRKVSSHAENLTQLDNGVKIPPSGWKCQYCDIVDNLWMNLSDGTVLCGRKFFDGTGGNNHAVEHYEKTNFPLAVKLGTITPEGADVFSYAEDDMVIDPKLSEHLSHFGIDMEKMKKTSVTMAEMEIEANMNLQLQFNEIQEAGFKLKPVHGPGYTGLINLGNSCYMNSVVQVLFSLPEFQKIYFEQGKDLLQQCPIEVATDIEAQTVKLATGLLSGNYSKTTSKNDEDDPSQDGITPKMFKSVIGRGHPEFSTNAQQDAAEYLSYLLEKLSRESRKYHHDDPSKLFSFKFEQRVECLASGKVRYSDKEELFLSMPVTQDMAVNIEEYINYLQQKKVAQETKSKLPEVVRPIISFDKVLANFTAADVVDNWYSPAIKAKTSCKRQLKFKTFPKYLACVLNKFYVAEDWTPQKLDASVDMPDDLDLSSFHGTGLSPNEQELPQDEEPQVELNEVMVQQLAAMGFNLEGCKKAVFHNPDNVEAAMEWVMMHMEDPDFAEPFVPPGSNSKPANVDFSPEHISTLQAMGFTENQAKRALKETTNNLERAADWLFSHAGDLTDEPIESEQMEAEQVEFEGSGRYKLKAIISHMGPAAQSGHYICHIFKQGRWIIFNDRKVAESVKLPRDLGYIYLYEAV